MKLLRKPVWLVALVGAMLVGALACENLDARGRGGGGGGGGGRAGGGGASRPSGGGASRSPSMSRPSSAPSRPSASQSRPSTPSRPSASQSRPSTPNRPSTADRPSAGNRPNAGERPNAGNRPNAGERPNAGNRPNAGERPTKNELNNFLDLNNGARPAAGVAAGAAAGAAAGGAAGEFLKNRPADGAANRPNAGDRTDRVDSRTDRVDSRTDRVSDRTDNRGDRTDNRGDRADNRNDRVENRQSNRPDRVENRQQYQQDRMDRRNEVRDYARDHAHHYHGWYGRDFWGTYPCRWHFNPAVNWWRWATWGTVAGWVTSGWGQPTYYNYGDNVYYQNDTVYMNNEPIASADEYAQQAQSIAESVPNDVNADNLDWLPLGVFALTDSLDSSGAEPTLYLQLAVSKEGIIAGTLQNTATEKVQTIEGMVDSKSQRAAWGVEGQKWPIMETGVSNLTEDDATALLHFENGETQQWLMIRMEDPNS